MTGTTGPAFPTPPAGIRIEQHAGDRESLRAPFALAEDSSAQLDAYIDAGRVLVAITADVVVGHLQLVDTGQPPLPAERTVTSGREVGRSCSFTG